MKLILALLLSMNVAWAAPTAEELGFPQEWLDTYLSQIETKCLLDLQKFWGLDSMIDAMIASVIGDPKHYCKALTRAYVMSLTVNKRKDSNP